MGEVTEYELMTEHGGYAPGRRFALVRRHLYSNFMLVSPVEEAYRGIVIPESKLRVVE